MKLTTKEKLIAHLVKSKYLDDVLIRKIRFCPKCFVESVVVVSIKEVSVPEVEVKRKCKECNFEYTELYSLLDIYDDAFTD